MSTQSQSQNQVSLKLIIDKKGKRIVYAEAENKFIDFLFTILSLPIGTVIKITSTQGMVGTLGNLYRSVDAMNTDYFQSYHIKDNLLNPSFPLTAQFQLQNLLRILNSSSLEPPTKYYSCYGCRFRFTDTYGIKCSNCSNSLGWTTTFMQGSSGRGGGYVKELVTYMVMDDLSVKPMSSMSSLARLKEFNMEDVAQMEEKLVYLDDKQGVKLLEASLHSSTVLSDVFLHNIDFEEQIVEEKVKNFNLQL